MGIDEIKYSKKDVLTKNLRTIVSKLRLLSPHSIILHGGYGRDEGSWVVENGEYRSYNDYDIFLIYMV